MRQRRLFGPRIPWMLPTTMPSIWWQRHSARRQRKSGLMAGQCEREAGIEKARRVLPAQGEWTFAKRRGGSTCTGSLQAPLQASQPGSKSKCTLGCFDWWRTTAISLSKITNHLHRFSACPYSVQFAPAFMAGKRASKQTQEV